MSACRILSALLVAIACTVFAGAVSAQPERHSLAETSCILCHQDTDFFDEESVAIVSDYATDVHAEVGLSCHDCHGGNPDPELAEDLDLAKDEELETGAFRGAPSPAEVPAFCGRCHSDSATMRRFKPDARIDQEAEYWTSGHGVALAAGAEGVATCVDCHGAHGTKRPASPESRVYPTQVAETCASCHSDPEHMAGRTLPNGRPIPTNQFARWRRSVHAAAMFDREDLTAPTCNDCHGNHGAAPPELDSVTYVCGQCHGREAEIFRASPKHDGFEEHNEFLLDAGEEGCGTCHAEEPRASMTGFVSFSECASCHGNHGVVRPSLAMFAALPATPCAFCHETSEPSSILAVSEPEETLQNYSDTLGTLIDEEEAAGYEGVALFDRLVDRALSLPNHTSPAPTEGDDGATVLRPEFERLFSKFRIGKTHYTYDDPRTGEEVVVDIVRCSTCHTLEGSDEDLEPGALTGVWFVRRMRELTERSARAERILLAARRGGVETREVQAEIDQAIDAQISLEVLVHTFSTEEDGPYLERYAEGVAHADAALEAGHAALDELGFRRRGLMVALAIIVLVLMGLGAKIRQLSQREAESAR